MQQSDVLNDSVTRTSPSASTNSALVPTKRPLEDTGSAEQPDRDKRPRQPDQAPPSASSSRDASSSTGVMPPPCDTYIRLRFQLARFKGVYRIVRLPLSFTFAHLYRYILLLFGWSGTHAHQAEVLTHVELYSNAYRPGEIKKHRSFRIPEEPPLGGDIRDDGLSEWQQWATFYARAGSDPAMRVSPRGTSYDDWMGKPREPLNMDDPWDRAWARIQVPSKKDSEVTLGDVWSFKSKDNISRGDCHNREVAIKFEYDLGASWEVHITVCADKKNEYMWKCKPPQNYPELIEAKGGPPSEDARTYRNDIEGKNKTVGHLLFVRDTFERYLKGEIRSVVRNKELAVYKANEPPTSVLEEGDTEDEEDEAEEDYWEGPHFASGKLSDYEEEEELEE
ncbi:hypothetical protein C8Q79DRAFT_549473 [Trametes meyenii]|nr:hypothetical protein C8Q79DRAFT_549473 [Trametes meyenii]